VQPDDTTAALAPRFAGWRDVAAMGGDALADLIRRDRIDVLIDLAGLTGGTCVAVMASRPAPVQVTYLGYPDTTGVPGVDYRLTDALADPPGAEAFASETLLRLPGCLLCLEPPAGAPPVTTRPEQGPVVFGSFNNPTKISDATLALWRGVLDAAPGSRLAIKGKGLAEPRCRAAFERRLAQAGLPADRTRLLGYASTQAAHLAAYGEVDIALDTFPYAGTTTTCEALWMGVPVVTLAGRTHASRMGASLLTAAGRPGWVAATPPEYARLAARLAGDRHALAETRASLREQTARSPLCNASRFVRRFEEALRDAWRARALGHPAARPAA
jgi:predicted O-linked N-acetylglucosamine transferase (SPINDLY family)